MNHEKKKYIYIVIIQCTCYARLKKSLHIAFSTYMSINNF